MKNIYLKTLYLKNVLAAIVATSCYFSSSVVNADEHNHMYNEKTMHDEDTMHDHGDNPVVAKVMFDQLEIRDADEASAIEAQAWIGKDLNKLWVKVDAERRDGETEAAELQALYSHAITSYWDMQIGLRKDIKPTPARNWAVLGVQGLAPYFFDVDAALFVGESGRTALRASAEYELLFTQRLILSPNLEINVYGQNDEQTATGAGLSDAKAGLRLRYEIRREFAPYVGINWSKKFGATANFAKAINEPISDTDLVLGLRFWF